MKKSRKKEYKKWILIGSIMLVLIILTLILSFTLRNKEVKSFEQCLKEGNLILESYPRQCSDGRNVWVEELLCENLCGDGICQEITCLGEGCPCPENLDNCYSDCAITLPMEIQNAADNSECSEKGKLSSNFFYNENSKTWWIDMIASKEFRKDNCNPACVVYEDSLKVEINWRCTGLI